MSHHIRISSDEAANVIVVEDEAKGERVLFGVPVLQAIHNDPNTPQSMFHLVVSSHIERTLGITPTGVDIWEIRRLAGCLDGVIPSPPKDRDDIGE